MEDKQQFLDSVTAAIGAAQHFLDTDRAYGSDDPRTLRSKERLAQTMQALTPTNVDIPELRVIRGGADRQPREVQRLAAPDAPPQAKVHEAIRRWGPRDRGDWDHER